MGDDTFRSKLELATGEAVRKVTPVSGGDINQAHLVTLASGAHLFVKSHARPPRGMFQAEAEALAYLRDAAARGGAERLVVPEVVALGEDFLALEALTLLPSRSDDALFGRELALLHRAGTSCFGGAETGFLATLVQDNSPHADWPSFYRQRRLEAQLTLPTARRLISSELRRSLARLLDLLDELCGPEEPPAPLHGDLWSGNWGMTERGPALFDPASYGGHREMDLAMLRLFGSPSSRFFDAYDEVYPRAAGHEERVGLYQLYPLLVHVNLFGSGYVSRVAEVVQRYA